MISLTAAIIAAFKANATLVGYCPGGIHKTRADKADFDFLVITSDPTGGAPTYSGSQFGEVVVTFSFMSNKGGEVAGTRGTAIFDAFKANALTLSSGQITNIQVNRPPDVIKQVSKDGQGNEVVMVLWELRYHVQMF